jgi:hypothetical protein
LTNISDEHGFQAPCCRIAIAVARRLRIKLKPQLERLYSRARHFTVR